MSKEPIMILTIVLALVLIGIFMVYSASAVDGQANARLIRELVYVCIGMATMFVAAHLDYNHLSRPIFYRIIIGISLLLLVAVLIPGIGVVRGGARRWIELGSFTFQPSEFSKFALILLLAIKLANNQDTIKKFYKGFFPCILIIGLFTALVFCERDLGNPAVMGVTAFAMLFVAGTLWRHLIPAVAAAGGVVCLLSITSDYRRMRFISFLDPWSYSKEEGYQLIQSMTGFARGSLWGMGPGAGEQKLHYLPEAHSDFIFAVWAEEMGLIGTLSLVTLVLALLVVSIRIALNARNLFGSFLATGIGVLIAFQAGFHMAVTTGLLPTKGLPLPFISWGGSSLIVFMGLSGILINVGLQAEEPTRHSVQKKAA